jgi:hypothetical protein
MTRGGLLDRRAMGPPRARSGRVPVTPVAIALVLVLVACVGQPAREPSAMATAVAASPPAGSAADDSVGFASDRYGYRLVTPADWTVAETPGTGGVHPDEPGVDTFKDRIGHILSVVGEPTVPALELWSCTIGRHLQGEHHLAVETVDELIVDGIPARLSSYHLVIKPYVIHYLTVELVRGGQGLTFSLESTTGRDEEDRLLLDEILGSADVLP